MDTINTDKAWKSYGERDPYFGVLTHDKYRLENLNEENKAEFFNTGKAYVNRIFNLIHKHFDSGFQPKSVLDFGCGTGRLTIGLAPEVIRVVGIDVSENMLKEARLNAHELGQSHIEFYLSDDNLLSVKDEQFDLVNTYIVLQHINVKRGMQLIGHLLDKIAPGGIGVLQMTYANTLSSSRGLFDFLKYRVPLLNNFINLTRGRSFAHPLMQMNAYDMNQILSMVQDRGIKETHLTFEAHGEFRSVLMVVRKEL